jgi:DNA-binding NarL/FixJ family response regulator
MSRTRVYLVDDHAMVRAGVRAELGDDVEVVGEAADVATAVTGIRETAPDVVLLDVHLPGGGGHAVLQSLRAELPGTRWLALSVSDAAEDVIAVIRAGARGYVTKTISGADLRDAVHRVAEGDVVFSPRLAGFVLDAFAATGPAPAPAADPATDPGLDLLSAREREVMQLLARGYTYREIGGRLFISVKTVESHASNVLRKLQLSNRNELTRWAATNRLL